MRREIWCASLCLVLVAVTLAACGGNSTVTLTFPQGSALALDLGQSVVINVTAANDSGQGVTWTCSGPACTALANITSLSVTFNAGGVTGTATITATSTAQPTIQKSIVITVNALPGTTTTQAQLTAAPATAGKTYTFNLTETGGSGTLTWSATGLPADGLSLNTSTGAISGTPTAKGTFNFTYTVTDSSAGGAKSSTSGTLTITVNNPPAPAITTTQAQVSAGTAGNAYAFTFSATGTGTLSWSATGLPADGLSLNTGTGAVSGTPASPQAVGITLTVSDTFGQTSPPASFTITINPAPLAITTTTLPQGAIGTPYPSTTFAATGGTTPYAWSLSTGSLPNGLSLNPSTGAISGTPSASAATSTFTIKATDASTPQMSATKSYTIAIGLLIATTSLPNGAVNTAYTTTNVAAEGGMQPYAWSVSSGTLPTGLVLNPSTGAISGTVAANAASETFTVQVQDSSSPTKQTATQSLTISIPLTIETTSLPNGAIGASYNQTVAAGGGKPAYTFTVSAGTLPDGLALNPSTGAITGTPKADAQSETFTIQVTDTSSPVQNASQTLSVFIPLTIETTTMPSGTQNVAYSASVAVGGGKQAYTWSTNPAALPTGLTLNAATGAITGTPTTTGTFSFTMNVTDSSTPPQAANQALSITITTLALSSSAPTTATINSSYNFTENASGGTPPYTYTLASGTLPAGLTMTSSNGTGVITISGTPTSSAVDESFSIKVTDSSVPAQSATSSTLAIVVNMVVATASPLSSGTVNTAYSLQINVQGGQPSYSFALDPSGSAWPTGLSMNSSGAISGTPTVTGTTNNIIVDVSDSATPAQTAKPAYSISINAVDPCATAGTGGESLLNGQYAFVLKGFDNGMGAGETTPEPAIVGGVLTFNGSGTITTGTLDMNLNSTGGALSNAVTSGSYRIGASGSADAQRVCMDITTASGTQHYRAALNSTGTIGHMIDFDGAGPFTSGLLLKQNATAFSTSRVTGNYAFEFSSVQNTAPSSGEKTALAGVMDLSTGTVLSGGEFDFNDGGIIDGSNTCSFTTCGPLSFSGGSYTINSSSGRGTLTLTASANGGSKTLDAVIYVVSAGKFLVLSSDDQAAGTNLVFGGTALQQSGPFSASSLKGTSVFYLSQPNGTLPNWQSMNSDTTVGTATTNGSGGITVYLWENNQGTLTCGPGTAPNCKITASYTAGAGGRVLLTGAGNNAPVFYLVSANEAFMLGGGSGAETGLFQPQTGTTASGTYAVGSIDPETPNSGVSDAVVTVSGGNVSGTSDNNSLGGGPQAGRPVSSTSISVDSTGFGQVAANCTTALPCQFVFYVVSPTSGVGMDGSGTTPTVQTLDQ